MGFPRLLLKVNLRCSLERQSARSRSNYAFRFTKMPAGCTHTVSDPFFVQCYMYEDGHFIHEMKMGIKAAFKIWVFLSFLKSAATKYLKIIVVVCNFPSFNSAF